MITSSYSSKLKKILGLIKGISTNDESSTGFRRSGILTNLEAVPCLPVSNGNTSQPAVFPSVYTACCSQCAAIFPVTCCVPMTFYVPYVPP